MTKNEAVSSNLKCLAPSTPSGVTEISRGSADPRKAEERVIAPSGLPDTTTSRGQINSQFETEPVSLPHQKLALVDALGLIGRDGLGQQPRE